MFKAIQNDCKTPLVQNRNNNNKEQQMKYIMEIEIKLSTLTIMRPAAVLHALQCALGLT